MVANALGCSEEEVEQTFLNDQPIRSMNTPIEDGSERCLHDCLYEAGQVLADEEMYSATLRQDLESALQDLNWREAEILRLYYGIGRDRPLTLVQIGIRFELTRERIRQIKELGLSKLRHPRFVGRLRAYTED